MFDIFNTVNEELAADEHTRNRSAPAQASDRNPDLLVVSVGGSLIVDENGPNAEKIRQIADALSSLHSAGRRIAVVAGGGKTARSYVDAARGFTQNNFELDMIGIMATRLNAKLLAHSMPNAHTEVLAGITESRGIMDSGKIPVFGGLVPFFTTDSVAALLAEYLGGSFVNLTNVDGIYDSDPSENPGAKRFDEIGYNKLISLIAASGSTPGQNVVLDLACCLILRRSKIPGVVLNGNDTQNFSNYANGYGFTGTAIRDIDSPAETSIGQGGSPPEPRAPRKARKRKKGPRPRDDYEKPNPYHIDF